MDEKSLFVIRSEDKSEDKCEINCNDLELLDISDTEEEYKDLKSNQWMNSGKSISLEQATESKQLIIGSARKPYPEEWLNQLFEFNPKVNYGLIQRKGGPCGVLAAIQAHILVEFLYLGENEIKNCLNKSIAKIIWKIGGKKRAIVAHLVEKVVIQSSRDFSFDGITEHLVLNYFDSFQELLTHVTRIISKINCLAFVYSCVLTGDVSLVRQQMDDQSASLIARHNYCSQELVNLLLVGKAFSNVFNNDMNCDSLVLHGIDCKSEIGFLSLHEYYQSFQVGSNYKCPKYPVFVVLSESHFSVLFSKQLLENRKQFQLFFFDGLQQQNQEIILDIRIDSQEEDNEELVPLECVIRTKWRNCKIVWNNLEKIL